jgi:predicted nucleic acid-binding protein
LTLNILVYAVDANEPVKSSLAKKFLRGLADSPEPLVIPWQVAVEFLASLRRWENAGRIVRSDTEAYLGQFLEPLPIVFPASSLLRHSLELSTHRSLSHWDSLLIAACIEAGIDKLYSEDMDDGMTYESVVIVNPLISKTT